MLEVFVAPVVGYAVLVTLAVTWAELMAERAWRLDARAAAAAPVQVEEVVEELRRAA